MHTQKYTEFPIHVRLQCQIKFGIFLYKVILNLFIKGERVKGNVQFEKS